MSTPGLLARLDERMASLVDGSQRLIALGCWIAWLELVIGLLAPGRLSWSWPWEFVRGLARFVRRTVSSRSARWWKRVSRRKWIRRARAKVKRGSKAIRSSALLARVGSVLSKARDALSRRSRRLTLAYDDRPMPPFLRLPNELIERVLVLGSDEASCRNDPSRLLRICKRLHPLGRRGMIVLTTEERRVPR